MTMERASLRESEKGFTLVELAVVMIIIGLLIGGILKGQELIANAQVTSTVAQVKGMDAAISTFRDQYDALPGDIANAFNRLPSCTAAPCNSTVSTQGDGRINGDPGASGIAAETEGNIAFSHLAAADLITGVNVVDQTAGSINVGDELPESEISGAAYYLGDSRTVAAVTGVVGPALPGGTILRLGNVNAAVQNAAGNEGLTPNQASRIDIKLDDGQPNTGTVRAGGTAAGADGCASAADNTGIYQEALGTSECQLFIRVQG